MNNDLTFSEKLVMKCIWDIPKDMVLSEIVGMVNERYGCNWAPQTVSTFLSHLVRKNFLEMTRTGKRYTYHPLITQKDYFEKDLSALMSFWGFETKKAFLSECFKECK